MELGPGNTATFVGTSGGNVSFGVIVTGSEGLLTASAPLSLLKATAEYAYFVPYSAEVSMNSDPSATPASTGTVSLGPWRKMRTFAPSGTSFSVIFTPLASDFV